MIRPLDETSGPDPSLPPSDDDERVGEAIEAYLSLIEQGEAPDPDQFAAKYPGIEDDVRAALQGLELVNGLVGHLPGSSSAGSAGRSGTPRRSLESGRRIAGYRIVRELGRGGMGTVYEAVHIALDRPVAFKILGTHAAPDSSARRRFLNEARTTARLHHTNIVPVFDVGQVGGLCYYAMQRIEGTGLDRILRRQRRLRAQSGFGPETAVSPPDHGGGRVVSPSNSSQSSRLGQLWIRVSAGWLKRPSHDPSRGTSSDGDEAETARRLRRQSNVGIERRNGSAPILTEVESTGSWTSRNPASPGRHSGTLSRSIQRSDLSLSSVAPTGDLAIGRTDDDEDEPHFTPPRGSAFYRWIAEVGLQAAEALAHAHQQGVIHRDIKPSNLLIDAKGTVWVTDFGLARRLADPGLTQHDSLLGTPRYMSPEQARPGTIDGRSDLFSLGGTLYELMTLRPAFDGRSAAELVELIANVDPLPPRSIDPRIPRDLETIVLKMLAKRPADRYPSAASLAEDLARFLNHEPVKARRISTVGRLWRVARRHPGITGVSSVAAATILAVATYAHVRVVEKNQLYLEQLRTSYWQNAALVRLSPGLLERRARGLDLIKKAAALDPQPDLKQKLRDEAVDFLALRDVEKSGELETGRLRGIQFSVTANRLVALADSSDGEQLEFWDINSRRLEKAVALGAGRGWNRFGRTPLAVAGDMIAAILPVDRNTRGIEALTNFHVSDMISLALGGRTTLAIPRDRERGARSPFTWKDRGIRLFKAETGEPIRDITTPVGNVVGVFGSPIGDRLVTLDLEFLPGGHPGEFQRRFHASLWNLKNPDQPPVSLHLPGAEVPPPPSMGATVSVGLSPDGETVAIGWGTLIALYSAEDGEARGQIDTQSQITALAIGPNDVLAAAGGGNIRLWDIETQTYLSSLTPTQNAISAMRFSPRGSLLALVGRDDATIELIDPVGRSEVAVLRTTERVSDLTFSPDGRFLLAGGGSSTSTTVVWKVLDSTTRLQFSGFDQPVASLAFRKDGLLAVGTTGGEIWGCGLENHSGASCAPLVSDPTNRPVKSPTATADVRSPRPGSLDVFPIGVAVRSDESASDREARGNRERYQPILLAYDDHDRLVVDHDSQTIRSLSAGLEDPSLFPLISLPASRGNGPPRGYSTLHRAGDGRTILVSRSSRYYVWRSAQPDKLEEIVAPGAAPEPSAVGEAVGPPAPRSSQNPPAAPKGARQGGGGRFGGPRYQAARIAPNGERMYLIAINNYDTGIPQAWDLHKGENPLRAKRVGWPSAPSEISTMALSRDGGLLALGERTGRILLVETERLEVVGRIEPAAEGEGPIQAIAFSPDGSELAVATHHGPIVVSWLRKLQRAQESGTLWESVCPFRLPVHRSPVRYLTFDARGAWLAGAGTEPVVEAWNVESIRRELSKLGLDD